MTSFHSYTFTLELQSVIEFNIVKKINKKKIKNTLLKKTQNNGGTWIRIRNHIFRRKKKRNHFFDRLPASECGEARLAAPSVRTKKKTPFALPARLAHSRATDLHSASKHTYTHTEFRHCICLLTPSHTDTARTWRLNRTHTREF